MSVAFGLLGPAAAWRDGSEIELGSPQQRALFALLLLHRNQVVSTDRMLDVLWPSRPPPNAVPVLRTYVSRLRAGPLAPSLLTRRHGYELRAAPGVVDAERLEGLVATARGRLETGDPSAAETLLREALRLVRGRPLAELAEDRLAAGERERLEELCGAATEELVEAHLSQGRHRELIGQLRATVAAEPLRERAWGQLMVALYRSGRQAEALAAYRAAARALRDELGLAPGEHLRALERMILRHAPALELPLTRASVVVVRPYDSPALLVLDHCVLAIVFAD